jgi:hypothetical protein
MSTSAAQSSAISDPGVGKVDMKFELVIKSFADAKVVVAESAAS